MNEKSQQNTSEWENSEKLDKLMKEHTGMSFPHEMLSTDRP